MQLLLDTEQEVTHNGVRTGRYLIQRVMSSMIVDKATCRKLLLAYSEMANNIVFHGEPKATVLKIQFALHNHHWEVMLSDNGGVWEAGKTAGEQEITLHSDMQWGESGRGLGIVNSIVDAIEYIPKTDSDDGLNRLSLRVKRIMDHEHKARVLLVCENEACGRQYVQNLESLFDIFHHQSLEAVLDNLDSIEPEIVLANIAEQSVLGYNLREALLSDAQFDLLPFVYLTDDAQSTVSSNHYLGIDDHLPVNATTDELVETIDRVLKTYRLLRRKFGSRVNIQINNGLTDTSHEYSGHAVASAMRSTEIGGGDYIFSQEKEGRTLIMLADLMGHDEAAKFFTYAHAGYFRGLVKSLQRIDLTELMQLISNASFHDNLLQQTTMTCIAACFYEDGSIGLCSAGHPPAWLINDEGCSSLPVKGTMPGLIQDMVYEEYLWQPKVGERIALFTDGLIESAGDSQARIALEEGVKQQLFDTRQYSVHQSVEKVLTWFDLQVGSPPSDDTTLILIDG